MKAQSEKKSHDHKVEKKERAKISIEVNTLAREAADVDTTRDGDGSD